MRARLVMAVATIGIVGCQNAMTPFNNHEAPAMNSTPIARALLEHSQVDVAQLFGSPDQRSKFPPDLEQWTYQHQESGITCEVVITFRDQTVESTVVKAEQPSLSSVMNSPCGYFESILQV